MNERGAFIIESESLRTGSGRARSTSRISRRKVDDIRARIVTRSLDLVHEQGFHRTTLAEFAKASGVPLGNFYYYFKTKESLGSELIDRRMSEYRSFLAQLERDPSPKNRLLGFVGLIKSEKKRLTECGCPVGSLTQELAKEGGPLAQKAGAVFAFLLDWVTEQFRALGDKRTAQALALQLMASLQGATVLANALGRADLLLSEANRLSHWIRELPSAPNRWGDLLRQEPGYTPKETRRVRT